MPIDSFLPDLPNYFSESGERVAPMFIEMKLHSPDQHDFIRLPVRGNPPKIVIADDDNAVIEGTKRSWLAFYAQALDIRYWQPTDSLDLLATLEKWQEQEQWRPDVVVLDINFADGGKHGGLHYLAELRRREGYVALAVVLATGNRYGDLDQDILTTGEKNQTDMQPSEWLKRAKQYQPEAILYGKTADAKFLGRIGEHIEDWKLIARRRAWVKLLQEASKRLDERSVRVEYVGRVIVDFVVNELGVDDAFIGQRQRDGKYKLMAVNSKQNEIKQWTKISLEDVRLLEQIVTPFEERTLRYPVRSNCITKEEAGIFNNLIRKRFLGIGAVLGEHSAGFITLLRDENKAEFAQEDEPFLIVLARLLASALRVAFLREMQTGLLEFAQQAAQASNSQQVCIALGKTLHRELHYDNNNESKTTVRLLDFETGELKRIVHLGLAVNNTSIFLNTPNSNYAKVVSGNKFKREVNVTQSKTYLETTERRVIVYSELCVPLSVGYSAIGAVNLEHITKDFYSSHDKTFVQEAATLAANAIERIRKNKLLEGMTEFALDFASTPYQELEMKLHDLLYEFCGFSVLVDLEKPQQNNHNQPQPWQIHDLDCRYRDSNSRKLCLELEKHELNSHRWGKTWASKLIINAKTDDWAWFTDTQCNGIDLTPDATIYDPYTERLVASKMPQKATALLLIKRNSALPHRAFLLMWALPPPMNAADIERLLGNLARLFSDLDDRQQQVQTLTQEKLMSEQAVSIAHVMQHFRHRLGNLTGSFSTHIDRLEEAYQKNKPERFQNALSDLRDNCQNIANAFHKSKAYIKEPYMQRVRVCDIVIKTSEDIKGRLQTQAPQLSINIDKQLIAYTDLDIASLVLYSLLENALDATKGKSDAKLIISAELVEDYIALRVTDNGDGVPESFRERLFQWGRTTKPDGLGSALSFARTRMALVQGRLLFPLPQPNQGALFEMQLALPPEENNYCYD